MTSNPVQNVRIDNRNRPKHQDSPIETEIFTLSGQLRQGIIGLGSHTMTPAEMLDDGLQQSDELARNMNRSPVSVDQFRSRDDTVTRQRTRDQSQFAIPDGSGPNPSRRCHTRNTPSQPQ